MCLGRGAADGEGRPPHGPQPAYANSGGARDDQHGGIAHHRGRHRRPHHPGPADRRDPGPLESAKAALFSGFSGFSGDGDGPGAGTGPDPETARLIRQRLLVTALRHGGALLAKLLSLAQPP
ncbi:hypothetical protein ACFQ10_36040 [Streptomyces indonesiensis]